MDVEFISKRKSNPRETSNIFSKISFWYTLPLFLKGFKRELEEEDLYEILPEYKSQTLGDRMELEWNQQSQKRSIYRILWKLVGREYLLLGLTKIVTIVFSVLRPLILATFISYFSPGQTALSKGDAVLCSVLLIGLTIVESIYRQNYDMWAQSLAIKFRAALGTLIYRKALNLSVQNSQAISFGKITNLLTRDVNIFVPFFHIFNESWTGFISTAIICYYMYQRVGAAMLVVVLALGVLIPCLALVGCKMASLKASTSEKTDERIATLQEVLSRIRTAKMYVWEKFIEERVAKARRKEMNILFNLCLAMFFILSFSSLVLYLAHYLVLIACIYLGQTLTPGTIYFVTSGFQSIAFNITSTIPFATYYTAQMAAALKRFQDLIENLEGKSEPVEPPAAEPRIIATNLTLGTVFQNLDFDLGPGLTLVSGPNSSGKSVLLLTILQEFDLDAGNLVTKGRISYVAQEPWLFPSTVKENILFGAKFDQQRYQKVVQACALELDFERLQHGDDTVVAEQGINLSKGQQCRICLARAVYKDSDIYLFDDCLSNLDPLVTNVVINKCIRRFLASKLVILVSSNPELVPYAHNIIKLEKGGAQFERNHGKILPPLDRVRPSEVKFKEVETVSKNEIYREDKQAGTVSFQVYTQYIQLGGGKISMVAILLIFLLGQGCLSYKEKLLSDWANLEGQIATPEVEHDRKVTLYFYTGVLLATVAIVMIRASVLFFFLKKVSINLHQVMLKSVINATMAFFDRVFIGNIVNRFSKDLVTIDENVPVSLLHIIIIVFETVGVLVLICMVNVSFLLPTAIFFTCLFFLRNAYLKSGRALKRLEATTKSPIVGSLNAALKGLSTIKTFHAQTMLKDQFDRYQDLNSSASYCDLACMKAFVFVVDLLTSLLFTGIILRFLLFSDNVTVGDVGLTLSQTFLLSSVLEWGFNKWAELEIQMTSAERVFEYTKLKQEPKSGLHLEEWPEFGQIHYQNVYLSYDGGKSCVLKNLNFVIKSGEKVGIVGRTGSGKSTIVSSIFRLYDVEGCITIDGVNTKTLALDFLRSRISVIPQDPLVFDGTLRYNLDPHQVHTDDEIWNVLDEVRLKHVFQTLESYIIETEMGFAQKQLICMARALLSKNRILLLDEITENGDEETERMIYDLVDRHFEECTVVRITHKMSLVSKCDRVFVVDKGEIVEQDSPQNLLQNRNSLFFRMVTKSDLGA